MPYLKYIFICISTCNTCIHSIYELCASSFSSFSFLIFSFPFSSFPSSFQDSFPRHKQVPEHQLNPHPKFQWLETYYPQQHNYLQTEHVIVFHYQSIDCTYICSEIIYTHALIPAQVHA